MMMKGYGMLKPKLGCVLRPPTVAWARPSEAVSSCGLGLLGSFELVHPVENGELS